MVPPAYMFASDHTMCVALSLGSDRWIDADCLDSHKGTWLPGLHSRLAAKCHLWHRL